MEKKLTKVKFLGDADVMLEYGLGGAVFNYRASVNGKPTGLYRNIKYFTEYVEFLIKKYNLKLVEDEPTTFTVQGHKVFTNQIPIIVSKIQKTRKQSYLSLNRLERVLNKFKKSKYDYSKR